MGFLASAGGSAAASLGLEVLGTGLQIFGGLKKGKEDAAAYRFQAEQSAEAATATRVANNYNEGLKKAEYTRLIADQTVAQAANGVEVAGGSAQRVRQATADVGAMDAAMMHYNAMREAYGYDMEAELYRKAAKNAKSAAKIGAVQTLLSGATSLASKWGSFKQSGALGSGGSDPYSRLNDAELKFGG